MQVYSTVHFHRNGGNSAAQLFSIKSSQGNIVSDSDLLEIACTLGRPLNSLPTNHQLDKPTGIAAAAAAAVAVQVLY